MEAEKLTKVQELLFEIITLFVRDRLNTIKLDDPWNTNHFDPKNVWDPFKYKREWCTLKISIPRRHGNTTLLLSVFKKYENNSIIITDNPRMRNEIIYKFKIDKGKVHTINNSLGAFRGENHGTNKIVLVDCASYMDQKVIDKIYEINAELFIFIG